MHALLNIQDLTYRIKTGVVSLKQKKEKKKKVK